MVEYTPSVEKDLILFEISSIDPKEEVSLTTQRFLTLVEMIKFKENHSLLRNEIKDFIFELLSKKDGAKFHNEIEALRNSLVMLY